MSKGSPIITVRIGHELLAKMDAAIASANVTCFDEPFQRTRWIKKAIAEKLAHLARSKKKKGRGGPP